MKDHEIDMRVNTDGVEVSTEITDLFKESAPSIDLGKTAEALRIIREDIQRRKASLDATKKQAEILEGVILNHLNTIGVESIKASGIHITKTTKSFPSFRKADTERVFHWLRSIGEGSAIKPTVHPQTFRAIVLSISESGAELPSYINNFEKETLSIRKA